MPEPAPCLPFRTVGFDLDGTLVDSAPDIGHALNHALGKAGIAPIPIENIRPMIGGGVKSLLARALAGGDARVESRRLDDLYAELLRHYEAHLADETRLYPGVLDALDALSAHGVTLGVGTNKLERLARKLLDALGIADRFACVLGGDSTANPKPAPDMLHELARQCGGGPAAFVGDSRYDVGAARAAGWPVVAVTFGYPGEGFDLANADLTIGDYTGLVPALRRL